MDDSQFNVFLCHNSNEKPQVEKIREQLKAKGIYTWLDKYDFEPFRPWQKQLEEVIPRIKAAAIFLGPSGFGPWHDLEMQGFLQEFVKRNLRMGLVILPDCPDEVLQKVPLFLKTSHHVDFRQSNPDPMDQLIWGITGKRPIDEKSFADTVLFRPDSAETQRESELAKLEGLLLGQKWKEADEQTKQIVLKDNQGKPLMAPQIREIPLDLLDKIDRLWMEASDQKFGLRIQQKIWKKILEPEKPKFSLFAKKVEPLTDSQAWNQFGFLVGWRIDEKLIPDTKFNFSIKSPPGCFPRSRIWLHGGFGNSIKQFVALMEKVEKLD